MLRKVTSVCLIGKSSHHKCMATNQIQIVTLTSFISTCASSFLSSVVHNVICTLFMCSCINDY